MSASGRRQVATQRTRLRVSELSPSPANPRDISPEKLATLGRAMEEFGDLSGIVFNRTTGQLVGGHQRIKNLAADDEIVVLDQWEKPNGQRTVAWGYVQHGEERWVYREVEADEDWEALANVAANGEWADWEWERLSNILAQVANMDLSLTGFREDQLEVLLAATWAVPEIDPEAPSGPGHTVRFTEDQWATVRSLVDHLAEAHDGIASAQALTLAAQSVLDG